MVKFVFVSLLKATVLSLKWYKLSEIIFAPNDTDE